MSSLSIVALLINASLVAGFTTSVLPRTQPSTTLLHEDNYSIDIDDVGFFVEVTKPLGVVFGENPQPYFGLTVDDLELGSNGAKAGIRVGDNLVSIDGELCVGEDFDSVMDLFKESAGRIELQMFRGTARMLYDTMPENTLEEDEAGGVGDDDEEIVMDENYEAPTVDLAMFDRKPLTAGSVLKAFKKIGQNTVELLTEDVGEAEPVRETEKKKGFFGLFQQETVQLEAEESRGYRLEGTKNKGKEGEFDEDMYED